SALQSGQGGAWPLTTSRNTNLSLHRGHPTKSIVARRYPHSVEENHANGLRLDFIAGHLVEPGRSRLTFAAWRTENARADPDREERDDEPDGGIRGRRGRSRGLRAGNDRWVPGWRVPPARAGWSLGHGSRREPLALRSRNVRLPVREGRGKRRH